MTKKSCLKTLNLGLIQQKSLKGLVIEGPDNLTPNRLILKYINIKILLIGFKYNCKGKRV